MTNLWFDHIITFTNAPSVDDYLKEYIKQGFLPADQTVRHDPGLRNGFIWFGPDYIEFCWVEDEERFAKKGTDEDKLLRKEIRPFEIAMTTSDLQIVHDNWISRGYLVPDVWAKVPIDAEPGTPPKWSFQFFPEGLLPGVSCFVLTYHSRSKEDVKKVKIPSNGIYAISGVTFVSPEAEERAGRWRELLAPDKKVEQSKDRFILQVGPHQAQWMTPGIYKTTFLREWTPASHSFGDIALLNLLSENLAVTREVLEKAGRKVLSIYDNDEEHLLIEPDPRDGFAFLVGQMPAEVWLKNRTEITGEKMEVV